MSRARILRFIERGMSGVAMCALFQATVAAGYITPTRNITFYIATWIIATVVSSIVAVELDSAEESK